MDNLRVAIIGTGFGARTQLPGFRLAGGWEVVSLCGRDPARTRRLAEEKDVPHALTDYRDAVQVGDPDLVCVSTPPLEHLAMALAAVEAGRHCLLEKPMAMDAGEARRLVAASGSAVSSPNGSGGLSPTGSGDSSPIGSAGLTASGTNPPLSLVDHELRALPTRQEMRRRVAAGDLGRPLSLRVVFTSHFRADPARPWSWWSSAAAGGGVLGAVGSHIVDALLWWFGEVRDVQAALATPTPERPDGSGGMRAVDSDDLADLLLGFASGLTGSVSMTTVAHAYEGIRWEMHGTEGSLWLNGDGRLYGARRGWSEREELSLPDGLGPGPILDDSHWARGTVLLARAIRDAIRAGSGVPFAATFADGLRTQRVLDAARRSAREGLRVRVE
jgi:predicted dehydrogenase